MGITHVLSRCADRFGVPFAILFFLFGAVKLLAKEQTQDDFIRELLFEHVTNRPYVQAFFGSLVVLTILGAYGLLERGRADSAEIKRLAKEKGELQQKLLGRKLSRSGDDDDEDELDTGE
jgi:hypothetical protein